MKSCLRKRKFNGNPNLADYLLHPFLFCMALFSGFVCPPSAAAAMPYSASQPPTGITLASATLNGMATPNGSAALAWFEWGTSSTYGQTTAPVEVGAGNGVVRVSESISNLLAHQVYHCRLVVSNAAGLAPGADHPFITGGFVTAWGTFCSIGPCDEMAGVPPPDLGRVVAVAAGGGHSLALRPDRTVAAWGYNSSGQGNVPSDLAGVVALSAGEGHNVALKIDGTVAAWGAGRTSTGVFPEYGQSIVPAGLSNIVALDAGAGHTLALRSDGTVVAWGYDEYGQATVPSRLSNVVAVASGSFHSMALRNDGTVVAWGWNREGETEVPADLSNVVAIAASGHSLALRRDGTVAEWPDYGDRPTDLSNVVAVAAGAQVGSGFYHNLALRSDGTVVEWNGETPSGSEKVVAISAGGGSYSLVLLATDTRYVDVNSANPSPPYTNWASAATTIQDAIDVALPGDEVVVTNGVYATGGRAVYPGMTNRVAVTKPLTVRSVNGPDVTVIRGHQVLGTTNGDGAVRCAYLTNGAALIGFMLTNGATHRSGYIIDSAGGGAWCESSSVVISNCVFGGNAASYGGGTWGGTLYNSTLINNTASGGGGAYGATLVNCALIDNRAGWRGGGSYRGSLVNCILTGNAAYGSYGMQGGDDSLGSGLGGGAFQGSLINSTVVGNWALWQGGGAFLGDLTNCIVYDNSAPVDANLYGYSTAYSCTFPLPIDGMGNITNAPRFLDGAPRNLRLGPGSPCINAGRNAYAPAGSDLEGNPRIAGGTVDIGAYEFQSPQSTLSYGWLQQHGLPLDGSADFSDPDHDGHNNWQEWRAGTVPTNPFSALRLLAPITGAPGVVIRWPSVRDRTYFLERSRALGTNSAFETLASNVVGQAGTTVYADTNAVGNGPFFYRVGVQE